MKKEDFQKAVAKLEDNVEPATLPHKSYNPYLEIEKRMQQKLHIMQQIIELKKNPNSRNAKFLKNVLEGINFFIENLEKLKTEYKDKR